jgi:hypothetical protein
MATVKKGILTPAGEWWKHLRWNKRTFWKGERQAAIRAAKREAGDAQPADAVRHEPYRSRNKHLPE